jgi:hypothetical protein
MTFAEEAEEDDETAEERRCVLCTGWTSLRCDFCDEPMCNDCDDGHFDNVHDGETECGD